jgi:hypothetical protein
VGTVSIEPHWVAAGPEAIVEVAADHQAIVAGPVAEAVQVALVVGVAVVEVDFAVDVVAAHMGQDFDPADKEIDRVVHFAVNEIRKISSH